jgi:hypothetical protein
MISVSVDVWKIGKNWPCFSRSRRSAPLLTRFPLWATASIDRADSTTRGWALATLLAPVVE